MFTDTSMTGSGMVVFFIVFALTKLGVVNVDSNQVAAVVAAIATVVSFVLMIWGQLRRNDLQWGFWRKTTL